MIEFVSIWLVFYYLGTYFFGDIKYGDMISDRCNVCIICRNNLVIVYNTHGQVYGLCNLLKSSVFNKSPVETDEIVIRVILLSNIQGQSDNEA